MPTKRVVLDGSQAALVQATLEEQQKSLNTIQQVLALRLAPIRKEHQIADGVKVNFGMDGDKAIMEVEIADAPPNGKAVIPPSLRRRGQKR